MDADVIVIGAGAAGLAAARALAERSLRVVLLEGRDRVGGRVREGGTRTVVAAELGAEFIHGPAPETKTLLHAVGTAAVDTAYDSWSSHRDGHLYHNEDDFISAAGIFEDARKLAVDESVDRFLERLAPNPAMQRTVESARAFVEGFEAADPAIASVRSIADELGSGVDSLSARPIGGYRPMFEWLSSACAAAGVETLLSTSVRRVSWRRGGVDVEVMNASGTSRVMRARAAIVTLPVGVLRHRGDATEVVFDPPLPAAKSAALEKIEMGHVVKVALWFRSAFWERLHDGRFRDSAFFRNLGGPFTAYWTQVPIRSELIVAWSGGPNAVALNGATEEELVERARDGFGTMLGELELARAEFDSGVTHDWTHDPFARGAYSYIAVGGGDARVTLAAPVGDTLFFAGEATSSDGQGGTVNGALVTGERAAREAASALATAR